MNDFNKALNYAFLLLKYRMRSKNELVSRLKKKRFKLDIIEKVIDYLEKNNYINDKEFSRLYLDSLLKKGYGKKRIEFNFNRLGIDKNLISEFLDDMYYKKNLEELIKKKISFYKDRKDKLLRFLLQRGYTYQEIEEALGKLNIEI